MKVLHLAKASMLVLETAPGIRRRRRNRRQPVRMAAIPGPDLVQEAATFNEIAADAKKEPTNWLHRLQRWIKQRLGLL